MRDALGGPQAGRVAGVETSMAGATDWRSDPEGVRPTVVFVGGFVTSPPLYEPLVGRLVERGASSVVVARIWLPDWILGGLRGFGAPATRAGRALLAAGAASAASPLSGGAPVLVVGHSAGGLVARLLTAPVPFEGRRFGAAARIGAIVTLGTPHGLGAHAWSSGAVPARTVAFLDEAVPGAAFTPTTGYLAVTSRAVVARPEGTPRQRFAAAAYPALLGAERTDGIAPVAGDGLVPLRAATLPGAGLLVLEHAVHGPISGGPWYGSPAELDAWWPAALATWRGALRARVQGAGGRSPEAPAPRSGERDSVAAPSSSE